MLLRDSVALRKESVDRNVCNVRGCFFCLESLSARRAWIEILNAETLDALAYCRSPQGERG